MAASAHPSSRSFLCRYRRPSIQEFHTVPKGAGCPEQRSEIIAMLTAGRSAVDIARLFRVHRATISRIVAQNRIAT
ncbi:helix-turn-helix domain-containing protein [Sinorhizobium sp. Sb3]|uniref:helix-turn-helix domain-containing protein n=1 Tax=Sinorhizobium sp. Sb3 TaxID=1358417 RepID=UPI0024781B94|nr:helix-turn-helix domain-containing protein [Sinorhizobium sp. Sb3]